MADSVLDQANPAVFEWSWIEDGTSVKVQVTGEKDPSAIPWGKGGADFVVRPACPRRQHGLQGHQ